MDDEKTCLVAGGGGFIGSHLVDRLLENGYSVVVVDNLITGRRENLTEALKNSQCMLIEHDIVQPLSNSILKPIGNISFIFHLASPASVVDYQKYPEETAIANSIGTRNLLELSHRTGAKFLFASTSEVYGDPKEHPQKETYWGNVNSVGIRSCYDESKRFGEMMTIVYERKYALDVRIIRIFNTYGPRMRANDGRVVSNFINQAIRGKEITVFGDGSQTRSFCFISDLVNGIMRAMFTEGTNGEVINLGNPEEYRMIDLAKKIKTMTDSTSEIVFKTLPSDDPGVRRPDIGKANKLLGWEPKVSVTEGLSTTIAYYRSL